MNLSPGEIRAAYFGLHAFKRGWARAGRPVSPAVLALLDRLDLAIRCPQAQAVSRVRHELHGATGELEAEWIGTAAAAKVLNWHQRQVQRRAADLDGRLVGGRLWFPARAVREYREALQEKGIK
jgi:hypothetical protein